MDPEVRPLVPSGRAGYPTANAPTLPVDECAPPLPADHRLSFSLYSTLDELMTELNAWAKTQGLGFVKRRSSNHVNGKPTRVDLICDRGNLRPSTANVRKVTTSKGADCPWKAVARALRQNNRLWTLEVTEPNHNHPASDSLAAHTVHRKLTPELQNLIRAMSRATSLKPREIYSVLRLAYPHAVFTLRDIENYRNRLFGTPQPTTKRQKQTGRSAANSKGAGTSTSVGSDLDLSNTQQGSLATTGTSIVGAEMSGLQDSDNLAVLVGSSDLTQI
ncbi:uncharacterized protein E0L32_000677 [Thyridium curvatum]|uniref:FAR1 domain-containing protein n=1 Tax=Thyridium curvatum TaxID=1093900 RepID=A0A507B345_9PEZI|nr:uncharacterized protein E0L32_000677 [Thyridium curvatum]TPX14283.1 hypothetical protein E0L32_000677 [Thyridium curvatum]